MVEGKLSAWRKFGCLLLLAAALPTRGEAPLNFDEGQLDISGDVPSNATASKYALIPVGKFTWRIPESTRDVTMDFSSAGYGGGRVDFPTTYPTLATVRCRGSGDDVPAIQSAITTVGNRAAGSNGIKGAVELSGTCFIGATSVIRINVGGVVLKGDRTARLVCQGSRPRSASTPVIQVGFQPGRRRTVDSRAPRFRVTDQYVPSGTATLTLASQGLRPGDGVSVIKSLTREWADAMKFPLDTTRLTLKAWTYTCPRANTASAPCPEPDDRIVWERKVASVNGNQIVLDAPISDNLDLQYGTAWVAKTDDASGRIQNVGIVGLTASAGGTFSRTAADREQERTNYFLSMDNVQNAWAQDLTLQDFNTAVFLDYGTRFITIQGGTSTSRVAWTGLGARPLEYATCGQQTLMKDITSTVEWTFSFATKQRAPGPNVFLRVSSPRTSPAQPHMLWATGVLIDSARGGAPSFVNRYDGGSEKGGHGWAVGYGVIWNGDFRGPPRNGPDQRGIRIELEKPPQGNNLALSVQANTAAVFCSNYGWQQCTRGYSEFGSARQPASLYEAQVAELRRIGG